MDEKTIRVEVTIEPSWTTDHHSSVIEIDAAELAGLAGSARQNKIIEIAEDYVNDVCSWDAKEMTE